MAEKISVYVDQELHRTLKAEASLRGKSLSEVMVDAALSALHYPGRQESATYLSVAQSYNANLWTIDKGLAKAAQNLKIFVEPKN